MRVENEVGRIPGSLALETVKTVMTRFADNATAQVEIELRNTQPRLLKYEMKIFRVELDSRVTDGVFMNTGGYIHPNSKTLFRDGQIKGLSLTALTGTLEFDISYQIVGSKTLHRTRRKMQLHVFAGAPTPTGGTTTQTNHTMLEEYED